MKVNASSWQHLKTHSVKACIYWPLSKQTVDLDKLSSEFFSLCCSIGSFTKSTSCCTHYNMFKPQRGELRCVEMNRASPAWCIHSSQVLFFKQVSKDRLHSPRGLCNVSWKGIERNICIRGITHLFCLATWLMMLVGTWRIDMHLEIFEVRWKNHFVMLSTHLSVSQAAYIRLHH